MQEIVLFINEEEMLALKFPLFSLVLDPKGFRNSAFIKKKNVESFNGKS